MFVKWYQFRSEVSVFVWGVGERGSSGTSGGEEERVGQDAVAWLRHQPPLTALLPLGRPATLLRLDWRWLLITRN